MSWGWLHQRGHRDSLTEQEAKDLVLEAIAAGIENDLGSGSNIDVCVITADRGLEHHRGAWKDPGLGSDSDSSNDDGNGHQAKDVRNQHGELPKASPLVLTQDEGVGNGRRPLRRRTANGAGKASLLISVRTLAWIANTGLLEALSFFHLRIEVVWDRSAMYLRV